VGVDPGTTVGWALLDLHGKVVECDSKRNISLDELIRVISAKGTVLIVGCDKAKVPSLVQDVATKFHAKVVSPKYDLSVAQKREMTAQVQVGNAHERDALASALLAYRRSADLLRKIRANLERAKKMGLFEQVCDLVVREGVSIHAAVLISMPRPEKKSLPEVEEEQDNDLRSLFVQLRKSRREVSVLRERLEDVCKERDMFKRRLEGMKQASASLVKPKSAKQLGKEKEQRIHILSSAVEKERRQYRKLEKRLEEIERFVLRSDVFAAPRMRRLGGKLPKIEGEVMFVDNPNEFSRNTVEALHSAGVAIVITGRPPSAKVKKQVPFVFLDESIVVRRLNNLVFVDKVRFERKRASREVLRDIVEQYKESRVGPV